MIPGRKIIIAAVLSVTVGCVADQLPADQGPISPPRVVANDEQLEGLWVDEANGLAVFKGIPFAAPPIGELRWRIPQPHKPRTGNQLAKQFAPACMQGPHIVDWYAKLARNFSPEQDVTGIPDGVSEDCLYLNIWTPAIDAEEKLPVMVWFHGGSNKGGWSYEPNYIGANLASRGVVVVTLGYRLGPFGFFSHPGLAASIRNEPVANFGWVDQVAALKWVNEHIGSFGGDTDNITAIGESSGAGDLANMIGAEIAMGYYRRSIAQSPASDLVNRSTLADERRNGEKLAAELGIANDDQAITKLRQVAAADILAASERAMPGHYFEIVIDDVTLSEVPLESLNRRQLISVDFLSGSNTDEWYMYLVEDTDWDDVDQWLDENAPEHAKALRALVADETDPRRAFDRLRTAKELRCPLRSVAARISGIGGRSWIYFFTRQRPGPGGDKVRAYHGTEIPYVFNTHDDWLPTEAIDRQLTDAVMDYWVQFARTGDPNVAGRPEWPLYDAEQPGVMELGDEVRAIAPVDLAMCQWLGPE